MAEIKKSQNESFTQLQALMKEEMKVAFTSLAAELKELVKESTDKSKVFDEFKDELGQANPDQHKLLSFLG